MFINTIGKKRLFLSLLILGCGVRILQYLINHSLWFDEANLALAVMDTPLSELHKPLFMCKTYGQVAPLAFLYSVKLITLFINEREYSLRIISVICGIIILPVIYFVSRKLTSKRNSLFVLFLCSINLPLIHFSTEFKPYILDAFTASLILFVTFWTFTGHNQGENSIIKNILFTITIMVSMWFSFTSVFVSFGVVAAEWLYRLTNKSKRVDKYLLLITVVIITNLLILNSFYLNNIRNDPGLNSYWQGCFVPLPISIDAFKWYINQPFHIMAYPVGFHLSGLTFLSVCIGGLVTWKKSRHKTILIAGPFVVTIIASLFRKYPFEGRLILFLVPSVILLSGIGILELFKWVREKNKIAAYIVIILFLLFPLYETSRRTLRPFRGENLRPVVEHIIKNKDQGHDLYVYCGAIPAFTYYARLLNYNQPWIKGINSRNNVKKYSEEIKEIFKDREDPVWFVFSHVWDGHGINEEKYFISELEKIAHQKGYFHAIGGASAYLFMPD